MTDVTSFRRPAGPGSDPMAGVPGATPPADARRLDPARLHGPDVASVRLDALRLEAELNIRSARSENTTRAYRSDLDHFALWCRRFSLDSMPATSETVALYVSALAGASPPAKVSTVRRRLVALSQAHKAAGHPSPTTAEVVRTTVAGIGRRLGSLRRQVLPLRLAQLRALLDATPEDDLLAVRDRALLLVGFAGGLRRSELSALDVENLRLVDEGVDILVRRGTADAGDRGRSILIPRGRRPETCPVTALRRWIGDAGLEQGPLFRRILLHDRVGAARLSPQGIARVVQRAAQRAGLDPREFAGHSLRAGFATEAAAQGASERAIMAQTGHRSVEMVRRYIRDGDRDRESAAALLGL
jgi:integrase